MDILVPLLRGVHLAALASLFGTLLLMAAALPAIEATAPARAVARRVARISAVTGLVTGAVWLVAQGATIAGTDTLAATLHAVPVVGFQTQFGHWLLLRLVLLVTMVPLLRGASLAIPLALAGVALAVQPLLGHAGAIGGDVGAELIVSEMLHMLAAGAWLGGLLPLFLAVGLLPSGAAAAACRAFSPIGIACVLLLAGTAVAQSAALMGGLPGLFGTSYGHVALVKLGLFTTLLGSATLNRFALTERLATRPDASLPIRLSIAGEIVLGVLVVIAAGFLASHSPGTHEQPVWPFAWRPTAQALDDPDLRTEAIAALAAAVAGVGLAAVCVAVRRVRWFVLGPAALLLLAAIPHLDLFFVAAYPTSFFTSPTDFAATGIAHGERLFAANCASCHGAEGRGDGPAPPPLPIRPADLTAAHFRAHSDGDLYWFIADGFTMPDGVTAMPGFAQTLSSEAIWHLIDYLRAHNAGDAMRRTGRWPEPVAMPQFDAQCANDRMIDMIDLRGRPLRIIAAPPDASGPESRAETVTILVTRTGTARPAASCVAAEPQVWTALAILLGVGPDSLAGAQVLVDGNGWLRAAWHPGDPEGWTDPAALAATIRDFAAHPIAAGSPAHHH